MDERQEFSNTLYIHLSLAILVWQKDALAFVEKDPPRRRYRSRGKTQGTRKSDERRARRMAPVFRFCEQARRTGHFKKANAPATPTR